ncbi:MAG: hypothetical protein H7Y17_03930 [Chlorobia bacterium]|nr:hypothetical protein [Fimbriimonadaceae bacterium]
MKILALVLPVLSLSMSLPDWTLTSESSGFNTVYENAGAVVGPGTLTNASTNPDYHLMWAVYQDKGEEAWEAPYSTDLAEIGYGIETLNMSFTPALELPTGVWLIEAKIRADYHNQQWHHFLFGTVIRNGYWESFDGFRMTYVEE